MNRKRAKQNDPSQFPLHFRKESKYTLTFRARKGWHNTMFRTILGNSRNLHILKHFYEFPGLKVTLITAALTAILEYKFITIFLQNINKKKR